MILNILDEEDIKQIAKNRPIRLINCPAMNNILIEDIFCFILRKCHFYKPISENKFECNHKKQTKESPDKDKLLKNLSNNQQKEKKLTDQELKEQLKSELKQTLNIKPQKFKVK